MSQKGIFFLPLVLFFYTQLHSASPATDSLVIWGALSGEWQMEAGGYAVVLSWSTIRENGTTAFAIERSLDGRSFVTVGEIAADGQSTSEQTYHFQDVSADTFAAVYRIRVVGETGDIAVSSIIPISGKILSAIGVEVTTDQHQQLIMVKLSVPASARAKIDLIALSGEPVRVVHNGTLGKGLHHIPLYTNELPCGLYLLRITEETQMRTVPLLYP